MKKLLPILLCAALLAGCGSSASSAASSAAESTVASESVAESTAENGFDAINFEKSDSLSANDLYAEFADKVALAKDARIVTNGDYVAIVIAGISNPDYSAIDTALETALNF